MRTPKVEPRPLLLMREHKPSLDMVKKEVSELRLAHLENRLPVGIKPWDPAVFVPMHGYQRTFQKLAGDQLPLAVVALNVPIVAALHTWTYARDIYRFDPGIAGQLIKSSLKGDIPTALLKRMPGWCVYVDTQGLGLQVLDQEVLGFFAHLDDDPRGWLELRLLFDIGQAYLHAVPLPLKGTIETSLNSLADSAQIPEVAKTLVQDGTRGIYQLVVSQALNLLLWLCSETPDLQGKGQPRRPAAVRTKDGLREHPVSESLRKWEVAFRYGAALRKAEQHAEEQEASTGHAGEGRKPPRPHVRGPHWNTYWTGPRTEEQTPVLRWIPPVRVMFRDEDDEIPAVIHQVQE